jgi:hypothetical protein
MKAQPFSVLVLLVCVALVLPFAPPPSAAREPPEVDRGEPQGPTLGALPPGARQSPEGLWYMPAGSSSPAGSLNIAPEATGGPDDFGYTWDDSETLGWIDATGGVATGLRGPGDYVGPIPIGFNFKYYENTYAELYITSSGFISFQDQGLWDAQSEIPYPSAPNDVIAPYWSPLDANSATSSGQIYYLGGGTVPNRWLAIEWHEVNGAQPEEIGGDDVFTFEVVLHEDGDIVFQYLGMEITGGWWCQAAGIEDSTGVDGLTSLKYCYTPASYFAVRFRRPAPSARVRIRPLHQGAFTRAGEITTFEVPVRNTGELGTDTYDLSPTSAWLLSLYHEDGVTPLTDTDADGVVDTGPVVQAATATVVAKVETPGSAVLGDDNAAEITVRSSLDTATSRTTSLRTAVPAPFVQVFRDDADAAMSLELIQPVGQVARKASPDWTYGYYMSVAETAVGFAHLWTRGRSEGSVYVREIECTLWDHYGTVTRPASRLTDHSGATLSTYDYSPVVAVAPNGCIGVAWYRYLYDSGTAESNYNIYFAVLDAAGNKVYGPTNVTNNNVWGSYPDIGWPSFYHPRLAATGDNRFVLAWSQQTIEAAGTVDDIYYAIRDTAGAEVVPVTPLTADAPGYAEAYYYPGVTVVGADRALLTWMQTSDGDIYYSVRDSAGNLIHGPTTLSPAVTWGYYPDAVELSNGHSLVAWHSYRGGDAYRINYAILDASYNPIAGPTILDNEAAVTGDGYVSVTADGEGHGILTWMDYSSRVQLYYALVGPSGELLTEPLAFYRSQAASPNLETSYDGYGNTSYSWAAAAGVDGAVAFGSPLAGAPPGGNAILKVEAANYGGTAATGVELAATLDGALTYVGDDSGITPVVSGDGVIWSLPDLGFLDSLRFRLTVQVPGGAAYGARYPVTLAFSSDGPEGDPSNNTAMAEVLVARQVFLPLVLRGY